MAVSRRYEAPGDASVVQGRVGSTEYAMLLTSQRSSERQISRISIDEDYNLHSEAELQLTLSHKLVRIVIETRQSRELNTMLRGADKPIAVHGWVTNSPSPILTVLFVDQNQYDGVNVPMSRANATPSRSALSQNK